MALSEKQKEEIANYKNSKKQSSKKDKAIGCIIVIAIFIFSVFCISQCGSCSDSDMEQAKSDSIQKAQEDSANYADCAQDVTKQFIQKYLNYGGDDNYILQCCNLIYPNIYVVNYNFTAQNGFGANCKMFANVIIHHDPKSKPEEGWELGTIEINDVSNMQSNKYTGTYDTDGEIDSLDRIDSIKNKDLKYAGE